LTRKASIVAKNYEPKRSAKSGRRKYFRSPWYRYMCVRAHDLTFH